MKNKKKDYKKCAEVMEIAAKCLKELEMKKWLHHMKTTTNNITTTKGKKDD